MTLTPDIFDEMDKNAFNFAKELAHARALDARAAKKPDGTVHQRLDVLISLARLQTQIMVRDVSMAFVSHDL